LNELLSLNLGPSRLHLFSPERPRDEEQGIDFRRLRNLDDCHPITKFPIQSRGERI